MRTVLITTLILFLSLSSNVLASTGDSSVNVNIHNSVNIGNSSQSSSKTETKVNISQEGEGTSSVKVNGKEWKLEGPGKINVNETSTNEPESSKETIDDDTTFVVGDLSILDIIRERIEEIKASIEGFIQNLAVFK